MKKAEDTINKSEFRFVGISRSGNHAIINWIALNTPGTVRFLNHCDASKNPYNFKHGYEQYIDGRRVPSEKQSNRIDRLIISYENQRLPYIKTDLFEKRHDLYVGESNNIREILILRDPFNLFASITKAGMRATTSYLLNFPQIWVHYAKEYLGITNHLNKNKLVINYNRWVSDGSYRDNLAKQLKLNKDHESTVKIVPAYGGGSSFDKLKFQGSSGHMNVFERWKMYRDDPVYHALFTDSEIISLSKRIFDLPEELQSFVTETLEPKTKTISTLKRISKELLSKVTRYRFLARIYLEDFQNR